jgi:hypothetical protein
MIRRSTVGIIEACLCCPDIGYICRIHDGTETKAIIEEMSYPDEPRQGAAIERPSPYVVQFLDDGVIEL